MRRMLRLSVASGLLAASTIIAPHTAAAATGFSAGRPVGAPEEDVGAAVDAGAVTWLPNGGAGLTGTHSITLTEATVGGTVRAGDRFGAAVAVDQSAGLPGKLVIGAPGADRGAGRVYVVPFSASQTRFDYAHVTVLRPGHGAVGSSAQIGEHFGATLAWGRATNDYLVIGAPDFDLGALQDVGRVFVTQAGATALALTPGSVGVPDAPHSGDHFGAALLVGATSVFVGVPNAWDGPVAHAGEVDRFTLPPLGSLSGVAYRQGSGGIAGSSEAGDHFGASLAAITQNGQQVIAIGAPAEDVGPIVDAGAVTILGTAPHTYVQGSVPGLSGAPEAGDQFGYALAGDGANLIIGVPGEDVGPVANAGQVQALYPDSFSTPTRMASGGSFVESWGGAPGLVQVGARFGASVSAYAGWLSAGASGQNTGGAQGGGAFVVLPGLSASTHWTTLGSYIVTQETNGVPGASETGDHFGAALA